MEEGLKLFLILVVPVMFVIYAIVGWLNYRENPLYWRAMLRMLTVGQVRKVMLGPDRGEGHTILVVREIKKVKRKVLGKKTIIVVDCYVFKGKEYKLVATGVEYSLGGFYRNTDPEPVMENERLCATKES